MGQLAGVARSLFVIVLTAMCALSCDRSPTAFPPAPSTRPATAQASLSIASAVPAATDILLAMRLNDRIVGISNYEPADSPVASADRIGDYHSLDWEKLYRIRPGILIVSRQKRQIEPIVQQRAGQIGMQIVETHIDRLDDIFATIDQLAVAAGTKDRGTELISRMRNELDAVSARVASDPRLRTLIVLDEQARTAVGSRNYLDDLLTIAGGENVAANDTKDYPNIDLERLLRLNPDAVVQLLPGAPPQLVDSATKFWAALPQLKAVRDGRIYIHTEPHLMLPGPRVVEVAALLANDLHPIAHPAPRPLTAERQPATRDTY